MRLTVVLSEGYVHSFAPCYHHNSKGPRWSRRSTGCYIFSTNSHYILLDAMSSIGRIQGVDVGMAPFTITLSDLRVMFISPDPMNFSTVA